MQTKAMSTGFSLASCCASVTWSARTGHRELRHVHGVGDAQPVLAHMLDMLGPGIDEGDVLARLHHMSTGIAADGARSDDRDLPAHGSPLYFSCGGEYKRVRSFVAEVTLADREGPPSVEPVAIALFSLDARELDHLRPLFGGLRDDRPEFRRRAPKHCAAQLDDPGFDLGYRRGRH